MVKIVENNIEQIKDACKQMNVKSLYLFGSATRNDNFNADSDLDFLFRFEKNEAGTLSSNYDYFDLLFRLQEITGKKVDLVAEEKIKNKYFLERVMKERVKIYEA